MAKEEEKYDDLDDQLLFIKKQERADELQKMKSDRMFRLFINVIEMLFLLVAFLIPVGMFGLNFSLLNQIALSLSGGVDTYKYLSILLFASGMTINFPLTKERYMTNDEKGEEGEDLSKNERKKLNQLIRLIAVIQFLILILIVFDGVSSLLMDGDFFNIVVEYDDGTEELEYDKEGIKSLYMSLINWGGGVIADIFIGVMLSFILLNNGAAVSLNKLRKYTRPNDEDEEEEELNIDDEDGEDEREQKPRNVEVFGVNYNMNSKDGILSIISMCTGINMPDLEEAMSRGNPVENFNKFKKYGNKFAKYLKSIKANSVAVVKNKSQLEKYRGKWNTHLKEMQKEGNTKEDSITTKFKHPNDKAGRFFGLIFFLIDKFKDDYTEMLTEEDD